MNELVTETENQIFTKEEEEDFALARTVRQRIIKEYTEDELPKSFDMDRLLTAVNHLETGSLALAKIRMKQQELKGANANNELLAKLIMVVQSDHEEHKRQPKIINEVDPSLFTLPDNLDVEPVAGGLEITDGEANPDSNDLYEEIFGGASPD